MSVRTQLSLLPEVPDRAVRVKATRPSLPAEVEKVLVVLVPELAANFLPRVYPGVIEIPVTKGHDLEKRLRKLGFKAQKKPHVEDCALQRDEGQHEWRYWHLAYTAGAP